MKDQVAQKSLTSMANKSDEKILKIIKNGDVYGACKIKLNEQKETS